MTVRLGHTVFACALAAMVAGAGHAETPTDVPGWRETRWGMTETEVLDALKGEAQRLATPIKRSGGLESMAIPALAVGPYHFSVSLLFKEGRLSGVGLTADKASTGAYGGVKDLLVAKYGPAGSEDSAPSGRSARWNFQSTRILLSEIRGAGQREPLLIISYAPPEKDLGKL